MIVYGCLMAFVARWIPRPVPDHIRRLLAVGGYVGWFLFGLLVQQQGFVDSVGESAGAAFALLLAVSVVGTLRRNGE